MKLELWLFRSENMEKTNIVQRPNKPCVATRKFDAAYCLV